MAGESWNRGTCRSCAHSHFRYATDGKLVCDIELPENLLVALGMDSDPTEAIVSEENSCGLWHEGEIDK